MGVSIKREVQQLVEHEETLRIQLRGVMAAFPETRNLIEAAIKLDLNDIKNGIEYVQSVCE